MDWSTDAAIGGFFTNIPTKIGRAAEDIIGVNHRVD